MDLLESRLLLTTITRVDYDPRMPLCKWVYSTRDDGVSGKETVTMLAKSVKLDGVAIWEERTEKPNGDRYRAFMSLSATEGTQDHKEIAVDEDGPSWITFQPPVILFPAKMQFGKQCSGRTEATLSAGVRATTTYSSTAIRFEKVTVAAGIFSAVKITNQMTMDASQDGRRIVSALTVTSWNVKGIGMVRESNTSVTKTYQNGRLADTTRGAESRELVSYSIPKATQAAAKMSATLQIGARTGAGGLILGSSRGAVVKSLVGSPAGAVYME